MPLIEKEEALKVLRAYNPWWTSGKISPSFVKKLRRTAYYQAMSLVAAKRLNRAILLSGPRRVGKTTILYQIGDQAINGGIDPANVLYLTLEHPILKLLPIDEILDLYAQTIAGDGPCVVLLDELQYVDRPTRWLKILVDRFPNWHIVATGSASITLKNKDPESGVGRWVEVSVPTLSFFEYLLLRQYEAEDRKPPMFRSDLLPMDLAELKANERQSILSSLKPFQKSLGTFLLQGGFPEPALQEDMQLAQRLTREDIVDKVLKRDMAAFYGVRKLQELEKLFVYMCLHTGSVLDVEQIGSQLKISRPTVYALLSALEGAHLVRPLGSFRNTGKKILKRRTKWYIADASMRNSVLLRGRDLLNDPQEMGIVMESAVINQLSTYAHPVRPNIGYWQDNKSKEVDLVMDVPDGDCFAIEVKYRDTVHLPQDEGIYRYLAIKPTASGTVVVKDATDFEKRIVTARDGRQLQVALIPAHVFLFLIGHAEYQRNQAATPRLRFSKK